MTSIVVWAERNRRANCRSVAMMVVTALLLTSCMWDATLEVEPDNDLIGNVSGEAESAFRGAVGSLRFDGQRVAVLERSGNEIVVAVAFADAAPAAGYRPHEAQDRMRDAAVRVAQISDDNPIAQAAGRNIDRQTLANRLRSAADDGVIAVYGSAADLRRLAELFQIDDLACAAMLMVEDELRGCGNIAEDGGTLTLEHVRLTATLDRAASGDTVPPSSVFTRSEPVRISAEEVLFTVGAAFG